MSTDQTPAAVTKLLRDDDATYRALAREADAAGDGPDGPERRIAQNLLFLSHELGCDANDLAAIVRAFPGVLALDADDDMRVVVAFLTGPIPTGGVGMTVAAARECVRRDPKMLAQSVKNKLSPKFEYLVEHAGLRPGNVGDMLRLDLETQIKPRVQFLALTCGMGSAAAAAAIRKSNPSQVHLLSKGFEDPGHNAHAALACMRAGQVSKDVGLLTREAHKVFRVSRQIVRLERRGARAGHRRNAAGVGALGGRKLGAQAASVGT